MWNEWLWIARNSRIFHFCCLLWYFQPEIQKIRPKKALRIVCGEVSFIFVAVDVAVKRGGEGRLNWWKAGRGGLLGLVQFLNVYELTVACMSGMYVSKKSGVNQDVFMFYRAHKANGCVKILWFSIRVSWLFKKFFSLAHSSSKRMLPWDFHCWEYFHGIFITENIWEVLHCL